MRKKRAILVGTTAAMSEQFNKDNFLLLKQMGFEVCVVGNFKKGNPISEERLLAFKTWINENGGSFIDWPASRNPLYVGNITAFFKLFFHMKKTGYHLMHCYTPVGSVIGRIAAKLSGTKTCYMAHGFHFYKGAPLKNWLLYFPAEWIMSWFTDALITINREDFLRAKHLLHAKRTIYVPGVGVDIRRIAEDKTDPAKTKEQLGLKSGDIMLFSAGELIPRKNHKVIIEALGKIKKLNPVLSERLHYFIAGKGEEEGADSLISSAKEAGIGGNFHLLGFKDDVVPLLKAADIFLFPSLQEGLSLALMEAMAQGVFCVASDIRGNRDLMRVYDRERLVSASNSEDWANIIVELCSNNDVITKKTPVCGIERFGRDRVIKRMRYVYRRICEG